jgi:hypothetical protein
MRYVRIFSDPEGRSHFEDVEVAAPATSALTGTLLSETIPVRGLVFRHVSGSAPAVPHVAPRRQFVVHLEGEVEVEVSDGEIRRFGPGSVVLVEDTSGHGHITRALGNADRVTLFITLPDDTS